MKKITTTKTKNPRKELDKYYTDDKTDPVVFFGLYHVFLMLLNGAEYSNDKTMLLVEPCAGDGAMVKSLFKLLRAIPEHDSLKYQVLAYDIAPGEGADLEIPIRQADLWELTPERIVADSGLKEEQIWRIVLFSNPPYQINDEPPRYNKDGNRQTINVMKTLELLTTRCLEWARDRSIAVELDMLLRLTQLEMTGTAILMNLILGDLTVLKRISFTGNGLTDMATTAWFRWELGSVEGMLDQFDRSEVQDLAQLHALTGQTMSARIARFVEASKTQPLYIPMGPGRMSSNTIGRSFVHPERCKHFNLDKEVELLMETFKKWQ